jgi:hypothetical protein
MGWWGSGNFDGDCPREYLANVIAFFERVVESALAGQPFGEFTGIEFTPGVSDAGESCLVPTVAIITALHEAFGSDYLPSLETVSRWKAEYLRQFDLPNPDFDWSEKKAERRRVIQQTFDRLVQHCRE